MIDECKGGGAPAEDAGVPADEAPPAAAAGGFDASSYILYI